MRWRCPKALLALFLAAGCGAQVTGAEIAAACRANLQIAGARSPGDTSTFENAVETLASQAPAEIDRQVKIVTSALRKSGPATEPDDARYVAARQQMDAYLFDKCDGPKQSIVALDSGYQSLTIASPAGSVRFRLSNGGKDDHQIVILTRPAGVSGSFDELLPRFAGSPAPSEPSDLLLITSATAVPGGTAYTTAELPPGEYLVACLLTRGTRAGQVGTGPPYYERGMKQQFTVG